MSMRQSQPYPLVKLRHALTQLSQHVLVDLQQPATLLPPRECHTLQKICLQTTKRMQSSPTVSVKQMLHRW